MRRGRLGLAAPALAAILLSACDGGALAEQPRPATIAILRAVEGPDPARPEPYLRAQLQEAGFVPGVNLRIVADDGRTYPNPDDAEAAVAAWREEGLDLIVALSSASASAAQRAAPDLPVLFISNDPTAVGLVRSEREPEGLLTGVTFRVPADRTLELSQRVIPDLQVVGLAHPPESAAIAHLDAVQAAAGELGLTLLAEEFSDGSEVQGAVDRLVQGGAQALLLSTSPGAVAVLEETAVAVSAHRIPVIANTPLADFALISLYPDSEELQRQLGRQAARLLSGSSPSAIPVEDPRRFLTRLDAGIAADLELQLSDDVLREANEVVTP